MEKTNENVVKEMSFPKTHHAFTLIELLVVVLIIGILAAVALPQYQKAVWKSRGIQLLTLSKSVATAQQAYDLANGTYPQHFSELDLSLDYLSAADNSVLEGSGYASDKDISRYNDLFEVTLSPASASVKFISGPYKGCGFATDYKTGQVTCREWHYYYKGTPGYFCQKIFGAGELLKDEGNMRYYPMN